MGRRHDGGGATADHGEVAITVDALFGNNSLVPVEGMDIPLDDLVRAAADERLTPATPQQIRNAGTSLGFPEFDPMPESGRRGCIEGPVAARRAVARWQP